MSAMCPESCEKEQHVERPLTDKEEEELFEEVISDADWGEEEREGGEVGGARGEDDEEGEASSADDEPLKQNCDAFEDDFCSDE